jgi:hypothetical protein
MTQIMLITAYNNEEKKFRTQMTQIMQIIADKTIMKINLRKST